MWANVQIVRRYLNVKIGNKAVQFHFWEYINRILFVVRCVPPCQLRLGTKIISLKFYKFTAHIILFLFNNICRGFIFNI
jgi:hypothetical protein